MRSSFNNTISRAAVLVLAVSGASGVLADPSAVLRAPELGNFGFDLSGMRPATRPGDDFYAFANGAWNARTQIPDDQTRWSPAAALEGSSEIRVRALIESAAHHPGPQGSDAQLIGDAYASFMDAAAIERRGAAPLAPALAKIAAIRTRSDLAIAFAHAERAGFRPPIYSFVEEDAKNASSYVPGVEAGGLGLPSRNDYLDDTPEATRLRGAYLTYVTRILALCGLSNPHGRADRVLDLEKAIAATHWTRAESGQAEKLYNPAAASSLTALYPGFDWLAYLDATGFRGHPRIIIGKPSAVAATALLTRDRPLGVWKDYLAFHAAASMATVLPKAFVDAQFAFEDKAIDGQPVIADRWKRGVRMVDDGLGKAVGVLYVRRYFPPDAKVKADALVGNIIAAMDARLVRNEWLAPATIILARQKLAVVRREIGFPAKPTDYSALEIRSGDAFGNQKRMFAFAYDQQIARLNGPVDPDEWWMDPQTINAYGNPLRNEIVFPAGILQPPYFDPDADPAVNYGAIGAIIGHELSHLFDDQGRKFDKDGNLFNWWTPGDVTRFKRLTDAVVRQYDEYEPLPGKHLSGEKTLSEDIADLAGVAIAFDAYHLSLKGETPPTLNGYSGDQRFFLAYAQIWREKARPAELEREIRDGGHTPAAYRVFAVRNLQAWYDAFRVTSGDRYYLKPQDRITIW